MKGGCLARAEEGGSTERTEANRRERGREGRARGGEGRARGNVGEDEGAATSCAGVAQDGI